jgi:hypothetical protein
MVSKYINIILNWRELHMSWPQNVKNLFLCTVLIMIVQMIVPTVEAASKDQSGIQWSTLTNLESNGLNDIAFDDEFNYVVVGNDRTILHSLDGKQWVSAKSPAIGDLNAVATNGKDFVAVGESGSLLTSKNGTSWSLGKLVNPPLQKDLYRKYNADSPKEYKSIGWGQKVKLESLYFHHVIWDGKRYIAIGIWLQVEDGTAVTVEQPIISTSINGLDWAVAPLKYDANKLSNPYRDFIPTKIAFNGSKYAIIAGVVTLTSSNLTLWDARNASSNVYSYYDILIRGKEFIALGIDSKTDRNVLYSSMDGLTWKLFKSDFSARESIYSISWDGKRYIGLNKFNRMFQSTDLKTWKSKYNSVIDDTIISEGRRAIASDVSTNKIIFDGKQHIAINQHGLILVHDDESQDSGSTTYWNIVRERAPLNFTDLLFDGKKRYVATGSLYKGFLTSYGSLWESSNGYDWTRTEIDGVSSFMYWNELASGNGTILAHGYDRDSNGKSIDRNQYYYSTAPGEWKMNKFPKDVVSVFAISWLNEQFYVVVNGGYITSKDGIKWSNVKPAAITMESVSKGSNLTLGVRAPNEQNQYGGELFTSKDGVSWKKSSLNIFNVNDHRWSDASLIQSNWNGKQFAVLAYNSMVGVSPDGINWKVKPIVNRLRSFAWNGKLYMGSAFGDGRDRGKMFYSYEQQNYLGRRKIYYCR